ncbi:blocked early in transport 1 [Puccinia sorghi]|uniref:Blocked early in transport 1 n=1 Tax=Puccinia sorghi TaxID=27349 RepID=A0A0L6VR08_9BASI|nr:blocked early in transport 1 [Puccinia sorghi]
MSRDPSRTAAAAHQQQQTTSASYGRPPIGSSGGSTPDHARPLMPTYGRTHPAPLHPPFQSSPSFHNHRTAEQLEAQNDDAIEGLSAKVRLLKDITTSLQISLNIGTEVKQSSSLIASLKLQGRYQGRLDGWTGWLRSNMVDGGTVSRPLSASKAE